MTYDANFRLTAITDASGKKTILWATGAGACRLAFGQPPLAASVSGSCFSGKGGTIELAGRPGVISQDGVLIVMPDAEQGLGVLLQK
jgi:hypothetical protein